MNERYLQDPATGSFALRTEGEITRWDKRKGSRDEVAVPPLHPPRTAAVRHFGEDTQDKNHTYGTYRTQGTTGATSATRHTQAPRRTRLRPLTWSSPAVFAAAFHEGTRGAEPSFRVPTGGRP
ncbi:hypothetical protein GCM10010313_35630 [Streptomyces violarus]|nr:hypothetical protein GCM10010313_35630 [Streptomyces violarus]